MLDGLDELARHLDTEDEESQAKAAEIRANCLNSLNNYLDRGKNAVICCRVRQFEQMHELTGKAAPVSAKVKINDLSEAEILNSLMKAQNHNEDRIAAGNLLTILNKDENNELLKVLSTPFYFTTALEVFDKQSVKEKVFPTDSDEVKKYLLDNFVESKINHTRNLTEFENDTAKIKKWLKWLAKLLENSEIVTFELAELQPFDLKRKWLYKLMIFLSIFISSVLSFNLNLLLLIFKEANKNSSYSSFFAVLKDNPTHFESWFIIIRKMKLPFILGPLFGFIILFISGNSSPARSLYTASFLFIFFTEIHSSSINTEDVSQWNLT